MQQSRVSVEAAEEWSEGCPHALHPGAIQGKEGIKFCHLATLIAKTNMMFSFHDQHRIAVVVIVVPLFASDSDLAWWRIFLRSKPLSLANFGADHHTFLRSSLDSCSEGGVKFCSKIGRKKRQNINLSEK